MTKIKICGLKRREDIDYINICKPDYVGFVFAGTKRKITVEQAKEFSGLVLPEIAKVGVFVNEDVNVISNLIQEQVIDVVQLHGDEDEKYISILREKMKRGKLIKAIRVASPECLCNCNQWNVDFLLFDTFNNQEYGGTGEAFDWSMIQNVEKPFFLAGGINLTNVDLAIKSLHPYAVDVSSAVETDGFKDRDKIMALISKVRQTSSK